MTDNEIQLLIIAAGYYIEEHATVEGGMWEGYFGVQPSREQALTAIAKRATMSVDVPLVLEKWKEADALAERLKHPCPRCGKPMVLRTNKKTQQKFWGCVDWKVCKPHPVTYTNYRYCGNDIDYDGDFDDLDWFEAF